MLLRLPDFDTMRETHGQAVVEELRSAMVNLLSTFVMRHVDALLARYFHSDFAVLLPHRTLKEAEVMASQLVNALGVLPTSSLIDRDALMYIGISAYRFGQTPDQVMDMAEQATRHAAFQEVTAGLFTIKMCRKKAVAVCAGGHCLKIHWRAAARVFIRNPRSPGTTNPITVNYSAGSSMVSRNCWRRSLFRWWCSSDSRKALTG